MADIIAAVRLRVLGPVRAWLGETELDLGPPKQRALLALLAVQAGRPVSLSEIIGVLWGESPPDTAVNVVHRHVGALRRLFEPGLPTGGASRWLVRGSGGYRLEMEPDAVDLLQFRRLRDEAERLAEKDERTAAAETLLEALSLWEGPTAVGIPYEVRAHPVFTAVDGEQVSALKAAAEYAPESDRVLAVVRQAAALYPLDEILQARLMLGLAATGQQAAALDVYRSVRATLADELGLDPGPELRAAHRQVLDQTPATDTPAQLPTVRPAQLPTDLMVFAGRRWELGRFHALLAGTADDDPPPIVTIGGMAGVGKTALAVHWAHQIADRFPDGRLYVDLHGFHPGGTSTTPAAEAMHGFLEVLGVPSARIPSGLDAQAALYRSLLAGRRVLVVLDNARDSEHVRPLLPGTPGCLTVVTSRHQLYDLVTAHGATAITLDPLPAEEAAELLSRRLGADRVAGEPRAVEEIADLSGRLPLTLAMVTARAAMSPGFPLAAVAEELRRSHGSLDAFAGESPRSDVRSVFAWSYRVLTPEAARLFRSTALHPGPDWSLDATASATGESPIRLRTPLTELLRAHLITEASPGRYSAHDLLRSYATELAGRHESAADTAGARARLYDHYLHSGSAAIRMLYPGREQFRLPPPAAGADPAGFRDGPAAAAWLHAEYESIIAAAEQDARDGDGRYAWRLATVIEPYLDRTGRRLAQRDLQETAVRSAEALGDQLARAWTERSFGFVLGRLGDLADADRHLARALELFGAVGDRDGQARTHRLHAFLANNRGRHQAALSHYLIAAELYRSTGARSGLASVHNEVGWTHMLRGEHRKALDECRAAIDGHREIGDRGGEAAAWDSLGCAQHHLRSYDDALVSFAHALRLYRAVGDRCLEADTLVHIGDTEQAAGRAGAARIAWRQALVMLDAVGHSDAAAVRDKLRGHAVRD